MNSAPNQTPTAKTNITVFSAALRTGLGKSEARRLRATQKVPAIAYGKDLAATPVTVAPKDVLALLKSERGKNNVVRLELDGGKELIVMVRDVSYHPVRRTLEHVDFVQVKLDQPVDVEIPLVFTGKALGVTAGGIVRQVFRTLPVRCLPDRIPLKVTVDISHLNLSEHISTRDLPLEPGVTALLPPEQTLIAIVAPDKDRSGDAEAATAAAAPAAGAAAPAKDAKAAAPAKDAKKK